MSLPAHLEQLVERVEPGGELLRAWPLPGGSSAAMTALEVRGARGRRKKMILRQPSAATLQHNPRAAGDEYRLLQVARSAGLPAPAPITLDETGQLFPAPYLVIDYIDGALDFALADRAGAMRALAAQLAQIHTIDGSRSDLAFLPLKQDSLPDSLGRLPEPVDPSFDVARIRDLLRAAWPWPQRNPPALLHGDYWPGNILWRADRLVAVVDWEDAARGDPLADLATSRLDVLTIFGAESLQVFTRHYLSLLAVDEASLPYWDLFAALRLARLVGSDLAGWAAFFAPLGRPDISARSLREHYRLFVAQALKRI